jgi:hypothetical protein
MLYAFGVDRASLGLQAGFPISARRRRYAERSSLKVHEPHVRAFFEIGFATH